MNLNLLIFNANQKDTVLRLEMPEDLKKIPQTFLTDNFELYILGET